MLIFGTIRKYLTGLMIGSIVFLIIAVSVQTLRVQNLKEENKQISEDIASIRKGIALTESLRKANAKLNEDQNDIEHDLEDAQGHNDPLSDDIIGILGRLRTQGKAP